MKKILLIGLILSAFSCGQSDEKYEATVESAVMSPEIADTKMITQGGESERPMNDVVIEQKIIKTGTFTFETTSVNQTFEQLQKWVVSQKGYVQSDQTTKNYDRISRNVTIRIPSTGFEPVVDSLKRNVKVFDIQTIEAQDVTEEFLDVEARMKAKKELENRYLQLLNKAQSVKDILEIETQLAQIREEIEAQEGRLKYLQNRVSYSTLNLNFYEITDVVKAPSQTYFSRLWNALKNGFTGIGELIIGLVTLWPLIVVGLVIAYFVRKKYKNKPKNAEK